MSLHKSKLATLFSQWEAAQKEKDAALTHLKAMRTAMSNKSNLNCSNYTNAVRNANAKVAKVRQIEIRRDRLMASL